VEEAAQAAGAECRECADHADVLGGEEPCGDQRDEQGTDHNVEAAGEHPESFAATDVIFAAGEVDFDQNDDANEYLVEDVEEEGEPDGEMVTPERGGEGKEGDQE